MPRLKSMDQRLASAPQRLDAIGPAPDRSALRRIRTPWRAWYSTRRWKDLRLEVLTDAGWICEKTGVMLRGTPSSPDAPVVDHKRPHRGDPALFWDRANLQAVCKSWHDSEKQRLEKRGLVR